MSALLTHLRISAISLDTESTGPHSCHGSGLLFHLDFLSLRKQMDINQSSIDIKQSVVIIMNRVSKSIVNASGERFV